MTRSGPIAWYRSFGKSVLYIFSQHSFSIGVWDLSLGEPSEAICRPPGQTHHIDTLWLKRPKGTNGLEGSHCEGV